MNPAPFPTRGELTIQFAHPAYQLAESFAAHDTGIEHFQTWTPEDTAERIGAADITVISDLWSNDLLAKADKLKLVQICAAGHEQFDLDALKAQGIRVAGGRGLNVNAVSEHALAVMLAFCRHLHVGRDRQQRREWRAQVSSICEREDELGGKTLLVYGLGTIGSQLARLGKVFDMHVIGIKRDIAEHDGSAHELHPPERLLELLPYSDFVVLTCPLTKDTRGLMNADAFNAMSPQSYLIDVSRGGCVDENALIDALNNGQLAGAGIDVAVEEPLPQNSPLWELENVILTPHTGGETREFEANVIDMLMTNLERLWRGEPELVNQLT